MEVIPQTLIKEPVKVEPVLGEELTEKQREEKEKRELSKIHGKVRVLEENASLDPQNSFVKAFEKERRRKDREGR